MSQRSYFLIILLVLMLIGGYFWFHSGSVSDEEAAYRYFKQGDFSSVERLLRAGLASDRLIFYKSYLEQAKGHFQESDHYLRAACGESREVASRACERLLIQATNAWMQHDEKECAACLSEAAQRLPYHSVVRFLQGLMAYVRQEYSTAGSLWHALPLEARGEEDPWMQVMVARYFPLMEYRLQRIHCDIEGGDFLSSRAYLERESSPDGDLTYTPLVHLLLGLTYLKEAEQLPPLQQENHYKLACFYLERSGSRALFPETRARVAFHIGNALEHRLRMEKEEAKRGVLCNMIRLLTIWQEEKVLGTLADHCVAELLISAEAAACCRSLCDEMWGSCFHVLLTQKMVDRLIVELKQPVEEDRLLRLWSMIEGLSPTREDHTRHLAAVVSLEMIHAIPKADATLMQLEPYRKLWNRLGSTPQEEESLAQTFFLHGKLCWQQEAQEEKGRRLMEYALAHSHPREGMEQMISTFLTRLYTLAKESNLIDRLILIREAMETFHMVTHDLVSPVQLANHLADANYLYQAHQYTLAKAHALWVLYINPGNEQAQRLLGMTAFHLGEYRSAIRALEGLNTLDEESHQALMISRSLCDQETETHLAHMNLLH